MKINRYVPVFAAVLAAGAAYAHVGAPGHTHGFSSGLMHPITGLDHLLAMVAVGLWAAQRGGRAIWLLPLTFVGAMAVGGALGIVGVGMPMVEGGIALSVFVLGLMVAAAWKAPLAVSAVMTGLFALCHGHAHGAELSAPGEALTYSLGFILATAALHAAGLAAALTWREKGMPAVRVSGGAIAAAGLLLLVGVL